MYTNREAIDELALAARTLHLMLASAAGGGFATFRRHRPAQQRMYLAAAATLAASVRSQADELADTAQALGRPLRRRQDALLRRLG